MFGQIRYISISFQKLILIYKLFWSIICYLKR